MMTKTGKFITIDGPNGVGKTTIVRLVCERLRALGWSVFQTKEPTSAFNRENEEKHGYELAQLIVEDRQHHLNDEIGPALRQNAYVVCDRYIESSLVYRKLDRIPFEDTWQKNSSFRIPDMSVLLIASPPILKERLKRKKKLSRFEREHEPEEEFTLYQEARLFLADRGFRSIIIKNEGVAPKRVSRQIVDFVLQLE